MCSVLSTNVGKMSDIINKTNIIMKWKLARSRDNLIKISNHILFLEFEDNGHFKSKHKDIKIGRVLLMSPFNQSFTWQTTYITEIIEEGVCFYHFKTTNSEYKLTKTI